MVIFRENIGKIQFLLFNNDNLCEKWAKNRYPTEVFILTFQHSIRVINKYKF